MTMRRRRARRELFALGAPPHEPTDELRAKVRLHAFNRVPRPMIARILDITETVLKYHYWRELEMTETEVLAMATSNVFALANQTRDLNVALRANETILKARSAHWREPRAAEPEPVENATRPDRMTLEQVEAALARLKRPAAAADGGGEAAAARPGDPEGAGEPR